MICRNKTWLNIPLFLLWLTSVTIHASTRIEVGFSPDGEAQQLVLKTINNARYNIRLMGYSFTSPEVAKALVAAHKRGVNVKVVLDEQGNKSRASWAAMDLLVSADIPLRTIDHYDIMHDKVIIADDATVQTGSFNYSRAAARSNSENVVVLYDVPLVAKQYLLHWQSRWEQGKSWQLGY